MKSFDPDDLQIGLQVLEATLTGETWFIDQIHGAALEHVRQKPGKESTTLSKDDFPTLASATGYRHVMSLTQFYFVLHALDCTSETQIGNLIDQHNDKIAEEIDTGGIAATGELKKAIFSTRRAEKVIETIQYYQRPVFSVSELGSLLIDLMAPRTTENLVLDLLHGGIMRQRGIGGEDVPPDTDPRRVLVEPKDFLLDAYVQSLVLTHGQILQS